MVNDSSKLLTLIAGFVIGIILVIIGAINLWLGKKDRDLLQALNTAGKITAIDLGQFSKPVYMWVSNIVLILVGVGAIIYGLFQYFTTPEKLISDVKQYAYNPLSQRLGAKQYSRAGTA